MTTRAWQPIAVAIGGVLFFAIVISQAWAGRDMSAQNIGQMLVTGIFLGAVYAILSSGLVVSYVTSGIFNFAHGAIGMFMAFVYWELRTQQGWSTPVAFVFVVFVAAPTFGLVLEHLVMRRLRGLPLVAQIMATVGLMLGLIGVTGIIWRPDRIRTIPRFFGTTNGFTIGGIDVFVTYHRLFTVVATIVVAVLLRVLLYRTRMGVAMRAVVDNEELAGLNGAPPVWVSRLAWMLSCTLAAMAGILISAEVELRPDLTSFIIITAMAAAVFGRLRSLPLTFAGGLLLGIIVSFWQVFLQFSGRWGPAREAVPGILLFLALLALPQARLELSRVSRRRPVPTPSVRDTAMGMAVLFVVVVIIVNLLSDQNVIRASIAGTTALVMLSLVPLTGWAGQVSLAQFAFAGVGTVAMWRVVGDTGDAWGLLVAAALAVPFGILMALPAIRLQGLYLALASLAFAIMMDQLFFRHPETLQPAGDQILFADLDLFGWRISAKSRELLVVMTAAFAILATALVALRRSRWGRRIVAMRDSPAACATLGVNIIGTKIAVFALSAAIAGFAGGFLAINQRSVTPETFAPINGLPFVLLLVVGGMASVSGALFGAVVFVMFTLLQENFNWSIFATLTILGPALTAIGIVHTPDGAAPEIGRAFARFLPWRADAREEARLDKEKRREAEIGELGLVRPFTDEDLLGIERTLALPDEAKALRLRPGYAEPAAPPPASDDRPPEAAEVAR